MDEPPGTRSTLRIGVMLPTTSIGNVPPDPRLVIRAAKLAEELGLDGVHVGDHLLHPQPMLESVVSLASVAAATDRISIGPCVLLLALREPIAIAKQLTTLAAFAPGRLRVGVGVGGEYPDEFTAVGVPLGQRGARLDAQVDLVRSLIATGRHPGSDETVLAAAADPPPFVFGGWSDPALRRAARLGDGWTGYLLDDAGFTRRRTALFEHRRHLGLTGSFTTGMLVPVLHDPDGSAGERASHFWARLTRRTEGFPAHRFATGSSEEIIDRLARFVDAGCDDLVLATIVDGDSDGEAPHGDDVLEQIAVIATEVVPHLRALV